MLAQLIMLIVMCMQRHWLYAAMLAPSLLGSALMLITMIMRVRHEETNSNTITGSDSPVPTHHNGNEIDHAQLFADMPSISFEHLHGLDNDPLIWRTIVRNWLVRSPTNGIGMSEHGIFHIDHGIIRTTCHGRGDHRLGEIRTADQLVHGIGDSA